MAWGVIFNFMQTGKFYNCGAFDQNCGALEKKKFGAPSGAFWHEKGRFLIQTY